MNLVLSHPDLTTKQRTKCVNELAGILTRRRITRDRSVLEVAGDVTGSTLSPRTSRAARRVRPFHPPWEPGSDTFFSQPAEQNAYQEPATRDPIPDDDAPQQMVWQGVPNNFYNAQSLPELTDPETSEVMDEPAVPEVLLVEKHAPSQRPPVPRTITRHGTEIFYGLVTPGNSPTKASGNHVRLHTAHSQPLAHPFIPP